MQIYVTIDFFRDVIDDVCAFRKESDADAIRAKIGDYKNETGTGVRQFAVSLASHITLDGVTILFRNHYHHCREEWSDDWDSMCNDKCPTCNAEIEPYESEEV